MVLRLIAWARGTRRNRFGLALIGLALCAALAFPTYLTYSASAYSRIRVLVATPDAGNVDVLINSIQIASSNKLGDLTPYTSRPSGRFGLRVFPPGASEPGKAYNGHSVVFEGGKDYTVIVYGKKADNSIDIVAEQDTNTQDSASTRLRFANYLPGSCTLSHCNGGIGIGGQCGLR